jgi:hypothetical protein
LPIGSVPFQHAAATETVGITDNTGAGINVAIRF